MVGHPCVSLDKEMRTDPEFLENLDQSQLRLLQRLASAFNTTILQLFQMASAASAHHKVRENFTAVSNVDCVKALLDLASEYWAQNDPDLKGAPSVANDIPVQGLNEVDAARRRQPYVMLGLICSVLMIAVAVFGIIGNAISVWFFGRLSVKSSINTMLTAMAVFDCVLLLTGAPLYSLVGIHSYTGRDYLLRSLSCCLIYFYTISTMSQTATAWMLVLITFERYIAVCRPFLARRLCTLGRARKAVLGVSAFAIAYNVVRFWEFESDSETGDARPLLRNHPYYRSIYMHWMYLTLVFLVPFSIIAFFNALIIRTIRASRIDQRTCRVHARAKRSNSNGSHASRIQSEHRTAAMLLMVVLVFMLCEALAPVLNALEMVGHRGDQHVFAFLSDLNNLLILVHSTVNVGIYTGFCSEFRRVWCLLIPSLGRLLCCRRSKFLTIGRPDKGMHGSPIVAAGAQRRAFCSVGNAAGVSCAYAVGSTGERFRSATMDSCNQHRKGRATLVRTESARLCDGSAYV